MAKETDYTENSIQQYLHEMGEIPMLSVEEEQHYASLAAQGDQEAKNKLIEGNLRLVVSLAAHYQGHGLTYQDLIQEGNIGLIKAADKFDISKGFRFSTYATWWINQSISRAIADKARNIRIPVHTTETLNHLKKVEKELTSSLGRTPSISELSKALDITPEEVKELKDYDTDTTSLDIKVSDDGDVTVGSLIEDTKLVNPEDAMTQEVEHEIVDKVLDTLPDREAKILKMRFGITTGIPMTLDEVGKAYNLSGERIRQIESKALRKLRHPSRARLLKSCI